jgi:hypothetical protein
VSTNSVDTPLLLGLTAYAAVQAAAMLDRRVAALVGLVPPAKQVAEERLAYFSRPGENYWNADPGLRVGSGAESAAQALDTPTAAPPMPARPRCKSRAGWFAR